MRSPSTRPLSPGESVPAAKRPGGAVYAGTVVEEGECTLEVRQASGQGRYDQIVELIQQSEQMKSAAEAKASMFGRSAGALHIRRESAEPGSHPKCFPRPVGAHGGLLLRAEAGYAAGGSLRYAGGGAGSHHRQGRKIFGGCGRGGHHRL